MGDAQEANGAGWFVGVDSGGTFTDLVALDRAEGTVRTLKVPSTPEQPASAVVQALERAALEPGVTRLVHGTTVTTNALLQRRGARLCLLTTAGFEDVAFIQRLNRRYAYNLHWQKPVPLVKRRHTVGVHERVDHNGNVVEALDQGEVERALAEVRRLVDAGEVEAVAICFLFSYVNDAHELEIERGLNDAYPDLPVSISSRVSPLWREYERTSTVLADAYVKPLISTYLGDLTRGLEQTADSASMLILKSNGGTGSPEAIMPTPLTTLFSGLAGGVVGGAHFDDLAGEQRCVTFDMGGTSTDIGLVHDGESEQLHEYEIEWGLPVATPVVDVHAIGAGGGSIARVDRGGLLRVGPESAGAVPGPACYGLGGEHPTVTDANLVLGRLDADYFLGGEMTLDPTLADSALDTIADRLSTSRPDAARAVVEVANESMANAIRLVTIERGLDPRDYALVAFGGAGPLHACGVADAVGISPIVVPPHPGLCSAFGAAIAQLRVDRVRSLGIRSDAAADADVRGLFDEMEAEVRGELAPDTGSDAVEIERMLDCRYFMQNYEQEVEIPDLEDGFLARACGVFHDLHHSVYGYSFEHDPVEFVHGKVTAREIDAESRAVAADGTYGDSQLRGEREMVAAAGDTRAVEVMQRGRLASAQEGPLVIEEDDSTIFVAEHWSVESGPADCLLLRRER